MPLHPGCLAPPLGSRRRSDVSLLELLRRSLSLVSAALTWLHTVTMDVRHGNSQRSVAELLITLAPRCLWPELASQASRLHAPTEVVAYSHT
eukprot:1161769-Amphidinium_carterae.2